MSPSDKSLAQAIAYEKGWEARIQNLQDRQIVELDEVLNQEEKEMAENSLYDFVRLAWRQIDSAEFKDNWHIRVVCEHLEALMRREIRCLVVNVPPRHMKSITCNVMLFAWAWAKEKEEGTWFGAQTDYIFSSYAQTLVLRDSVKARMLINSPWYQKKWPVRLARDQGRMGRYSSMAGGTRLSVSVGGAITGDGGDVIVVDDAHNATEATSDVERASTLMWHDSALSTRDNDPKTSIRLYIAQRLHEDDLIGHILEQDLPDCHVCFPARYETAHPFPSFSPIMEKPDPRTSEGELLWPNRFGDEELQRLERSLGSYGAAGQLQQRPAPAEGGMIKPDNITLLEELPRGEVELRVRGWDFAGTEEIEGEQDAAWTVGVLFAIMQGDDNIYIEDVYRLRGGPETVKQAFLNTCVNDGEYVIQDIPQDPGSAGLWVASDLVRAARGYPVKFTPESGDKIIRAMPFSNDIETGRVYAVNGEWWRAYRDELAVFPLGKYKDQVDASSRAHQRVCLMLERFRLGAPARISKETEERSRKKAEAEETARNVDDGWIGEDEKRASGGRVSVVAY